jgi:Phage integrase family
MAVTLCPRSRVLVDRGRKGPSIPGGLSIRAATSIRGPGCSSTAGGKARQSLAGFLSVPLRRPNAELRTREHLTPSEVESLVEAAKANRHGHRDATMLAYRHGLRACELVDLEWSQVDFKAAVMHVRRAKKGTPATHPPRGDEPRALRKLQRKSAASSKITPALGPLRRGANLLSTPRYIEQSQGLPRSDNLSVAKPSDDTSALHNLDVVSVDRRFDRPDNICVVFADEDEGGADNASPRMELINSIGGHDGGLPILHSGTVSLEPCLCRNRFFP